MEFVTLADGAAVAAEAARSALFELEGAVAAHGLATWVIAGGTSPQSAYRILTRDSSDLPVWQHTVFLVGDERCVPEDHPDSNWRAARQALVDHIAIPEEHLLRPNTNLGPEEMADDYEARVRALPTTPEGAPRLDLVWLGIGEDGHTLSLFPGRPEVTVTDRLVIPIHNSPKPPPDRITLTLPALAGTTSCLILAAGIGKAPVVEQVHRGRSGLPIEIVASYIEAHGGRVRWLLDQDSASLITAS